MQIYQEGEEIIRHRDMVYQAEISRLSGERTYSSADVDAKMEEIFRTYQS